MSNPSSESDGQSSSGDDTAFGARQTNTAGSSPACPTIGTELISRLHGNLTGWDRLEDSCRKELSDKMLARANLSPDAPLTCQNSSDLENVFNQHKGGCCFNIEGMKRLLAAFRPDLPRL